jgi:hypothetical protein
MKYTINLLSLFLVSCDTKESVESDLTRLKTERSLLKSELESLEAQRDAKNASIKSLDEKLKVLNIYDSGKRPKYVSNGIIYYEWKLWRLENEGSE